VIEDIIYGMNKRLLLQEMGHVMDEVRGAHELLRNAGLEGVANYRRQMEADLFSRFERRAPGLPGRLFVVVRGGQVAYDSKGLDGSGLDAGTQAGMFLSHPGIAEYQIDGQPQFCVYETYEPWEWLVGISLPKADMFAKRNQYLRDVSLLSFAVLLLASGLSAVVVRRLVARVRRTLDVARRVEAGDLSARVDPITHSDEIAGLQHGINAMVTEIEKRTREIQTAREDLAQSERNYRHLFENAIEGIFRSTPDGRFLEASPSMARMFGYDSSESFLSDIVDIAAQLYVNPDDRLLFCGSLEQKGMVTGHEVRMRKKNGEEVVISFSARTVREESGAVRYFEGFAVDITERKFAEQELAEINRNLERLVLDRTRDLAQKAAELKEANQRLVELDKMKSAFLSSVSHELRTPLTSILGFAKLVDKEFVKHFLPLARKDEGLAAKGERIHHNLAVVTAEGGRLTRLINDVLDLNKIESGRMEWRDSFIPPAAFIDEAVSAVSGMFQQNPDVRLLVDIPSGLPPMRVDKDKMVQVLVNLLNNGAKFTRKGFVRLEAGVDATDLTISVTDTGKGVPQADLEKIFDKFHQVLDDTIEDKPKGTGLGLAICRQIMEHYHGRIWAESTLGQGSVFRLSLPLALVARAAGRVAPVPAGQSPLVLLVDDDTSILSYLAQVMEAEGYRTICATDGMEALALARQHKPDCITMDIMMPVMDGKAAISALRADPELASIPVLVVSVLKEVDRAGGDAALTKPFDDVELLGAINALLGRAAGREPMMVLRPNGPVELGPFFTLVTGEILQCTESELWARIEAGFKGTVLIPAAALGGFDLGRLASREGVKVLLLPQH